MRENYPKTLLEIEEWFNAEAACVCAFECLRQSRWPEGFVYPHVAGRTRVGTRVVGFVVARGVSWMLAEQERWQQEKGPKIAQGRTAEIFLWKDNQVLKLFRKSYRPTAVEREARTTQAVHAVGPPVPLVKARVEVEDRLGIVFERVEGPSMWGLCRSKPWKVVRLGRALAGLHAEMHSRKIPELPSLRGRLEEKIRTVAVLPSPTKKTVLKILEQLPEGSAVCHGDFHPDQIIMSRRGPIIVDWIDATQGNPLADVTRTLLILQTGELPPFIAGRWLINRVRGLFHSIYLRSYLQLHPASREQIAAWQLPVAAARLTEDIPEEKDHLLALIEASLQYRNS